MTGLSPSSVRVRPARKEDKAPLMKFIKHVWGGHDYIPRVWDDWLEDKNGRMFVVEADGVPVGMNRVRFTEDGEAWFEGVRVHPEFRGKGLASLLGENSMKVAKARGAKVFRLTSSSWNHKAHRQIDRMGFVESSRISTYGAPKGKKLRKVGAEVAQTTDLKQVLATIRSSREFSLGSQVFWHLFTAATLNPEVVRRLVKEGSVKTHGKAVCVTRRGGEGANDWVQVCFVGGDPDDAAALVGDVLSTRKKGEWGFAYVPQGSPIISELRRQGYERDFSLILFERKAAKG